MKNLQKVVRHIASPEKQSGQAIVLIAMLMIILLASLGLAIDGGGMYLLWRDAQNAADAAALQAAFAYCTSGDKLSSAVTRGYQAVANNGFDNNGIDNWVTVGRAVTIDASLVPSNAPNPNSVILVEIIADKPPYFIQLVYGGPLQVDVKAVGACTSGGSIYDGYSVFTMGSNAECGFTDSDNVVPPDYDTMSGSALLDLGGADTNWYSPIFSNGNISITGAGSDMIADGAIELVGGINGNHGIEDGSGNAIDASLISDTDAPLSVFPELYNLEDFAPSQYNGTAGIYWTAVQAYQDVYNAANNPGKDFAHYEGGNLSVNGTGQNPRVLEGLYFVNGNFTAGQNTTVGSLGVTIVATGTININTDAGQVWRPFSLPPNESLPQKNLPLFFTTYDGSGSCTTFKGVEISGNQILALGVIYAPSGDVNWSGSGVVYCGSMISFGYTTSASEMHLFGDKLPDYNTLVSYGIVARFNKVDWAVYQKSNCDYIDSSPPSYFLAPGS
jgi:hypothetical protein